MYPKLKILALLIIAGLVSCNPESKSKLANLLGNQPDSTKLRKQEIFDSKGTLKSIVSVKDTLYHGPAEVFYPSGKLAITCNYHMGRKQGTETKYYTTGEKYRVRHYKNGKIQGLSTYYYKSGVKKATLTYKNGLPGSDLKEYNEKGKLITDYPDIVFNLIDETNNANAPRGKRLQFRLSNWSGRARFYENVLIDGKYLDPKSKETPRNGKFGERLIVEPKAGMQFNIVAKFTTRNGCPKIISKTYTIPDIF